MVGGGRVLISSGIYMSGSITLRSNVDLHINYSNKTQNVKITVKDGYSISTVFGSEIKDGTLEISANDAALYKMEIG